MVRQISLVVGVVLVLIALAIFIFPTPFTPSPAGNDLWPWTLTPLTARVIGGWFALPGVVGIALSRDARWSSWRIMIESQLIALVLILLAVFLTLDSSVTVGTTVFRNPQSGNVLTWLFVVGMAVLLAAGGYLYYSMEMRRRQARATVQPA
jgi:hypothetical protein